MQTRKHPRTLTEAFGPYTSADFERDDPMPWADKVVLAVCCAAGAAMIVMVALGWLA